MSVARSLSATGDAFDALHLTMQRIDRLLKLKALAIAFLIAPAALVAQSRVTAMYAYIDTGKIGHARYQLLMPTAGVKKLVLYAHGYRSRWEPPMMWGRLSPILQAYLERGFAVALSEYRRQGWAVREGIEDTEALRQYIVAKYGKPDTTFISGGSMGGLIAVALIEQYPQHYDGALTLCGVLDGTLSAGTRVFDMLVAFDYFFPNVITTPLHRLGDASVPDTLSLARVEAATRRDSCAAHLISSRFALVESDLPRSIAFAYELLRSMMLHAGGQPFDTRNTVYFGFGADSTFNRRVLRFAADSAALESVRMWYTPTGKLQRPLVALHTTYDNIVSPASPNGYAHLVMKERRERYFVQLFTTARGHCAFGVAERGRAFDLLRSWASTGKRPTAGELYNGR